MADKFIVKKGTRVTEETVVENGSLLFATEEGKIYIDDNDKHIEFYQDRPTNDQVDEKIKTAIEALDAEGQTCETGEVITSVVENNGVITVNKKALTADDIPEIPTSKVTDLDTTLAGKQDTLVFNTIYNPETNKAATMEDVTTAVSGLSGAMHYIGESTIDPAEGSVAIEGKPEYSPKSGDVVTYNAKEFVYDGSKWRELGDESSFAVKGSIKNSDIAADAAIEQSKIAGLTDDLASKATPQNITDAINELDVEDSEEAGKVVSSVSQTDGKISVTRRALIETDIPELSQSKITNLTADLAAKQDLITFNTAYDASTNKAATMKDIDAVVEASSLTWGTF